MMEQEDLGLLRQIVGAELEGDAGKIAQLDGLLSEIRAQFVIRA
jgi:hypothetical protein